MARGRTDIANTALRIFLQDMGAAYDQERGLGPYNGNKDFPDVRAFFGEQCCYCGTELEPNRVAQDHLVPMNKKSLGLDAWGNVVPACRTATPRRRARSGTRISSPVPARAHRSATSVSRRSSRSTSATPTPNDLRDTAQELYEDVGSIAMTLIGAKVKRVRDKL
jgi:hypothetical protein